MALEVGRIDKAHGVRGEVVVSLSTNRTERLAAGTQLSHDGGSFTVVSSRPHQHRFVVSFAEIIGRDQADAARGTVLYADPIEDPDVLWVHDLIDQAVSAVDGEPLGTVTAIEQNPASDLIVLDTGALIPLTFFVEQRNDGTIVVDPPAGLLELTNPSAKG